MEQLDELDLSQASTSTSLLDCESHLFVGGPQTLVVKLPRWFLHGTMQFNTTKGRFTVNINLYNGNTEFKQWKPFRKPDLETLTVANKWRKHPSLPIEVDMELHQMEQKTKSPTVHIPTPPPKEETTPTPSPPARRKLNFGFPTKPGKSPTYKPRSPTHPTRSPTNPPWRRNTQRRGRFLTQVPLRKSPMTKLAQEQDQTPRRWTRTPGRRINQWRNPNQYTPHRIQLTEEDFPALQVRTPPPPQQHKIFKTPPQSPSPQGTKPFFKLTPTNKSPPPKMTTHGPTPRRPTHLELENISPLIPNPEDPNTSEKVWNFLYNDNWSKEILENYQKEQQEQNQPPQDTPNTTRISPEEPEDTQEKEEEGFTIVTNRKRRKNKFHKDNTPERQEEDTPPEERIQDPWKTETEEKEETKELPEQKENKKNDETKQERRYENNTNIPFKKRK